MLGPYIQNYWSLSVSPSAVWATWISPVSSCMELTLSNVWFQGGAWGKILGCWKINVRLTVSPEWGCLHLMKKGNFRLLAPESCQATYVGQNHRPQVMSKNVFE